MRDICAALAILLSIAAPAVAQEDVKVLPPTPNVRPILLLSHEPVLRLGADDVVARLMQFDRNNDFKIEIDELPERMQTLVVRGDRSDDLKLDIAEIRRLTGLRTGAFGFGESPRGSYGFGDISGTLSSRVHILNSIDDLRLAPQKAEEAKRIALAQADDVESTAGADAVRPLTDERRATLIARLSSVLTEEERDNLNAALARRPLVKVTGLGLDVVTGNLKTNGIAIDPAVR